MIPLTLLLLSAALYTPHSGLAAESEPTAVKFTTTLEALGYPNGLSFDASSLPSERTLLFYLPKEMRVKSATLRLVYRGSPQLGRGALLRTAINDQPPQTIELEADKQAREWLLPVPASDLAEGQVKVTLSSEIPVDYDTIVDGEPQSGSVHIAASTQLVSTLQGEPVSLRDAWLTLPDDVLVSVPRGTLSEAAFRSALDWVTLLQRSHRNVRITTLPNVGDVVVAPEGDILAAMAHVTGQSEVVRTLWSNKRSNVGLVAFGGKTFLAVTDPSADPGQFVANWQELGPQAYLETLPTAIENGNTVALDVRGLSTIPAQLVHKLQWTATLTPWNLPPGRRVKSATIQLKLPHVEPREVFRFYLYLNEKMVGNWRFWSDGTTREIIVPFDMLPHAQTYQVRLVARNGGASGGKRTARPPTFRVTPQSYATLERASQIPAGLSALPTTLGHGFELSVPREYLSMASRYLAPLGQLLAGFVVPSTPYKLVVMSAGQAPMPHGGFIVVGDTPPVGAILPLRFDEGKVRLVNYRGEQLVEDRRLRAASIVQLISLEKAAGIWFRPGEQAEVLPVINTNLLGGDDVAIYERDQLTLSMDSRQGDLIRPNYLERRHWHEHLYAHRMMWLQLAWLLLTLVVLYLHVKSRQHRNG